MTDELKKKVEDEAKRYGIKKIQAANGVWEQSQIGDKTQSFKDGAEYLDTLNKITLENFADYLDKHYFQFSESYDFRQILVKFLRSNGEVVPDEISGKKNIDLDWDALYVKFDKEMYDVNEGDDERDDMKVTFNWFKRNFQTLNTPQNEKHNPSVP